MSVETIDSGGPVSVVSTGSNGASVYTVVGSTGRFGPVTGTHPSDGIPGSPGNAYVPLAGPTPGPTETKPGAVIFATSGNLTEDAANKATWASVGVRAYSWTNDVDPSAANAHDFIDVELPQTRTTYAGTATTVAQAIAQNTFPVAGSPTWVGTSGRVMLSAHSNGAYPFAILEYSGVVTIAGVTNLVGLSLFWGSAAATISTATEVCSPQAFPEVVPAWIQDRLDEGGKPGIFCNPPGKDYAVSGRYGYDDIAPLLDAAGIDGSRIMWWFSQQGASGDLDSHDDTSVLSRESPPPSCGRARRRRRTAGRRPTDSGTTSRRSPSRGWPSGAACASGGFPATPRFSGGSGRTASSSPTSRARSAKRFRVPAP